ncbi:sensor histidine kinase [Celeribacter indicus]|uniref:histidine kinase n=1 Tax=Celeribacter indicus TaxID=1208324 RepID=A0A0B5DZS5_9RHOB|nr:histidine kinase dimerization/phosphoacceptor domain -containing protein [Celeribacter indicus]AJE46211.1 sensor signal transduction histidine kinase [Celeribacter indicus]SDW50087.1 Two-component sensor histidine kinase, contains HisKA and HATPase domains [Celeribacter indicus]
MIRRLRAGVDSLTVRVAVMLAAALLPIGVIAIAQSRALIRDSRDQSEVNLLALTSEAAANEEALMRTAFGAAQALAGIAPELLSLGDDCHEAMTSFVSDGATFAFAGIVSAEGLALCSSGGEVADLSGTTLYQKMRETPHPRATLSERGAVSGRSVLVVSYPILDEEGRFMGYTAVSQPHVQFFRSLEQLSAERPVDLVTFNEAGEPLSIKNGMEGLEENLPEGRTLDSFVGKPQHAFTARTASGERRVFAYVPIVPGLVYGLGSWDAQNLGLSWNRVTAIVPLLFPVLMWLACLIVVYIAIQRQVIQPTRDLRARMLLFMRSRRIAPVRAQARPAAEFREMDETFVRMANSILHDEAELEDALHDKTVLLREVHHRVKNNLQLIASILNMKIRKAHTPDAKVALRDLQTRVMGLATVHRSLYETSLQGRVQADELMRSIAMNVLNAGQVESKAIEVEESYAPLVLYPDQAVPLSLIASEALSNALKYGGSDPGGTARVSIRLDAEPDSGDAVLTVVNSRGSVPMTETEDMEGSGLGNQLILAFTSQLEGRVEQEDEPDHYTMRLRFPLAEFREDAEEAAE